MVDVYGKELVDWNVDDVTYWIHSCTKIVPEKPINQNLRLQNTQKEKKITGSKLAEMTREDFKTEFDFLNEQTNTKLFNAVQKLKEQRAVIGDCEETQCCDLESARDSDTGCACCECDGCFVCTCAVKWRECCSMDDLPLSVASVFCAFWFGEDSGFWMRTFAAFLFFPFFLLVLMICLLVDVFLFGVLGTCIVFLVCLS
eukprot:TRINITY_DN910_c0_g1_i1.p1 TRINITY_DN910_c0_g1~~TRINITY_DN910_c0_g1_i1.p1  ORF type:complete len:200 (-),score=14.38 TRINITY_DN910_c0_g1_i1:78-677(-)